jgi:outer membrane cobalamin receptor
LVNINGSPGRGAVGTDLNPFPYRKIEVLRDGASAQYGSDAIAGVININMKKTLKIRSKPFLEEVIFKMLTTYREMMETTFKLT